MTLSDMIRRTAVYEGPSKMERCIWNAAIEAACRVVDANVSAKPQVAPEKASKKIPPAEEE